MALNKNPLSLSDNAVNQIKISAEQSKMQNLALRFAVSKQKSGQLQYAMGFDDINNDQDIKYEEKGIKITIDAASVDLLQGTLLDFVKLNDGEMQFVFSNPNDANYSTE